MKKSQGGLLLLPLFLLAVALTSGTGVAMAGDSSGGPRLEVQAGLLRGEQLSGDKGEYDVSQAGLSAAYGLFKFSVEERGYSWDEDKLKQLPFGNGRDKPWEHLRRLELSVGKQVRANQDWSFFLEAGALAAYEEELGGLGGRLRAWAGYDVGPALRARFGGRLHGYQAGRAVLIPELALDYNQGKTQGFSASLGIPEAQLKYAFSPHAALRLAGWLDLETYQLAEDSTVEQDGYLENRRYLSGLFLDLQPVRGLDMSLGLTRSLGGTMTIFDKDGDDSREYDLEGAWGVALNLSYNF